ncbi:hypothetical protein, partial [Kitasatospora sp. A2-31]|uniref:hypothetical protein n=1 Tax=Kitasatospora sp. A2-31 TaxID=2916414 RepID=UPI001EEDB04D
MKRQLAFGEVPTGTPPAPGDLSHPRVQAYLDIFDDEATLREAGSAPQRGRTAIGTSITGSLRLAPDFRYRGTEIVAEGASMMFGQRQRHHHRRRLRPGDPELLPQRLQRDGERAARDQVRQPGRRPDQGRL